MEDFLNALDLYGNKFLWKLTNIEQLILALSGSEERTSTVMNILSRDTANLPENAFLHRVLIPLSKAQLLP